MAISTFDGPVRSLNGFYSQGPGNLLTLGATVTLSVATHAGHTLLVPATCAIILPTIVTTADPVTSGPGSDPNTQSNLGVEFVLFFNAISAGALPKPLLAVDQINSLEPWALPLLSITPLPQ